MAPYAATLALCFDPASDWALTMQPGQPKLKYMGEAMSWYGAIAASHPYARLPLAFCDSLAPLWRERAMVDVDELDDLRTALQRALATSGAKVTTFTLVQAWGRR